MYYQYYDGLTTSKVKIMVPSTLIYWFLLVLFQIGFGYKKLPNLEISPFKRYIGFESKAINITCPIHCKDCPKANISWLKHGNTVDTNLMTVHLDGTLHIKRYISGVHNGSYSCIWTLNQQVLHSAPIHLASFYLPEYTVHNTSTKINNTAVFRCYRPTLKTNNLLNVQWFRSDSKIPLLPSTHPHIYVRDEILFFKSVQLRDKGSYRCLLTPKDEEDFATKKSEKFYLKIDEEIEDQYSDSTLPLITFFTPSRDVELHQSFTIRCLLSHYGGTNVILRLFKLSEDEKMERKVHEQTGADGLLEFTIASFEVENAAFYVCEVLHGNLRTRRQSIFNFMSAPVIAHKEIIHYNQILHANVTLVCDVTKSFPVPSTKWYYNGRPLVSSRSKRIVTGKVEGSSSLVILNIDVNDQGAYQCIVENSIGSDSKYFDVALGTSEFAPKDLFVKVLSPVQVMLSWTPGKSYSTNRTYIVSWFHKGLGVSDGHIRTPSTSVSITGKGLYGGRKYRFLVCLYIKKTMDYSDCVAQYATMPELPPLQAPEMSEPKQESSRGHEKTYFIHWKQIPAPMSMGMITNYTIYCQRINIVQPQHLEQQQQQQQHNELLAFSETSDAESTHIFLPTNSTFKVWMTAFNDAGESPASKSFYVHTSLVYDFHSDVIELSVKWSRTILGFNVAVVKWKTPANFTGTGFRLYYVPVPYKDYWESFKSMELDRNKRQKQITDLSTSVVYRFTIASTYLHRSPDLTCLSTRLGKTSSAYLNRRVRLQRGLKAFLGNLAVVENPRDLKCHSFYKDSLLITWRPPETGYNVTYYHIEMFSEENLKRRTYVVYGTILLLRDLNESAWYGVRVRAYVKDLKATFRYTPYIPCLTNDEAPSIPRNASYKFIYSKLDKFVYLKLQWQRPLFTGFNTYSYIVRRQPRPFSLKKLQRQHTIKMNFPLCEYSLIDDGKFHVWLVLGAVKTEGNNVEHRISITAVNNAGTSEPVIFKTRVSNIPDSWLVRGQKKNNGNSTKENHDGDSSTDLYLGVVVGLSISAVFLAVLFILCLVKEPWKRLPPEGRRYLQVNDFLFVQKMKEETRSGRRNRAQNARQYSARRGRLKFTAVEWLIQPFLKLYHWKRPSRVTVHSENTEQHLYSFSSGSVSNRPQFMMKCMNKKNSFDEAASSD